MSIDFSEAEIQLSAAFREMSKLTGLPLKQVMVAEAGSILKDCAGKTKVASVAEVTGRARRRLIKGLDLNKGDITINAGTRKPGTAGRIWAVSHGPRAHHRQYRLAFFAGTPTGSANSERHWLTRDWIDIMEAKADYTRLVKKAVSDAVNSIGLARQSWVQIADSLGIRLENVPGGRLSASGIRKARQAIAKTGKYYINGLSRVMETTDTLYIDLVNKFPAGERIGFSRILYAAVNNRLKHFEKTLELGVFESEKAVAQQYPGFYVK